MEIIPVVISGGAGSRLWPMSREDFPKPFIELPTGGTLIGRTYQRAAGLPDVSNILTVTNRNFLFLTLDAYADTDAKPVQNTLLLEPFGRDTAPAVALATLFAAENFAAEATLLLMPSDHLIDDELAFSNAVLRAVDLAQDDHIVTFGIVPGHPETGFGYIEVEGNEVRSFVEKPDLATARAYLNSGRYFWNSGMFCFKAATMIAAMQQYCPEILEATRSALTNGENGQHGIARTLEPAREQFANVPAISIDYAVMEKAGNVACVPVECGWSDVGSWSAMADLLKPDENGNRTSGHAVLDETTNSYVHSEDRLVSLVGVDNLLVIDTPDALLVTNRNGAQQVKEVFNRLKVSGNEVAKLHRTAHRPWGTYTVLEEGDRFKIKRIVVKPGSRLSLQAHHHRSEHWVVVSGTAKVVNGEKEILLTTNQSTYIPCGFRHRLENPGILPLVLIEVQSGDYLGEDDIVRFEDVYGRA